MVRITIVAAALFSFFIQAGANALGDLAATMKAGDWKTLSTTNMPAALAANGSSGGIMGYADGGGWDPASEQFFFIGSDHCEVTRFVAYDAATNAWRRPANPYWINTSAYCNGMGHGYDHNTINVASGVFYCRPMSGNIVYTYNIAGGTWGALPTNSNFYSVAFGMSHFPEAHGLFVADVQIGSAFFYTQATNQWKTLPTAIANTAGCYHSITEYNPVHKVVIFGGGNGNSSFYKIDSTLKMTRLKDTPVNVSCSGLASLLTVDPVSGDHLIFTSSGKFYTYDVVSDTWTLKPGSNFFGSVLGGSGNGAVWDVVATPISNYGVVMFAKDNLSNSAVYLYKHAVPTSSETAGVSRHSISGMSVTPQPAVSSNPIQVAFDGGGRDAQLTLCDVAGRKVENWGTVRGARVGIKLGSLAAGVYALRARVDGKIMSKKLVVSR